MKQTLPSLPNQADRDASQVIRGFFYQVQLTVLRWLQLPTDTVLYCEYGEDIYHAMDACATDIPPHGLLEQIKIRSRISLRSPESLAAIVHCWEARRENSSMSLLYRFSTTAVLRRERNCEFPRGLGGIDAWRAVSDGEFRQREVQAFVVTLKAIVKNASCPKGIALENFRRFREHVVSAKSAALVRELIKPFEWAIALPAPPLLNDSICDLLVEQKRAASKEQADEMRCLLLVCVLEILTRRGLKPLTQDSLDLTLRDRAMSTSSLHLLARVLSAVQRAEDTLGSLAAQVSSIEDRQTRSESLLEELVLCVRVQAGTKAELETMRLPPPDEPPREMPFLATRRDLVGRLGAMTVEARWVAVTGAVGMGKTTLASLLARSWKEGHVAWISLHGEQSPKDALNCFRMHTVRMASSGGKPQLASDYRQGDVPISTIMEEASSWLGPGSLLVVDELPDLTDEPRIAEDLLEMAQALKTIGGHLLTTGQRRVPSSLDGRVPEEVAQVVVPDLTEDDIREALIAAGAPEPGFEQGYLTLLSTTTRGHPALLQAMLTFLRRHDWRVDKIRIASILTDEPLKSIKEEAGRRLLRLLPGKGARHLLYRLSLISGPFTREMVSLVGAVPPVSDLPHEEFAELVGPWITRVGDASYEVNSLLRGVGHQTLESQERRYTERQIARWYLGKPVIGPVAAMRIVLHLISAAEWEMLSDFVMYLVSKVREKRTAEAFELITMFFTPSFPEDVPHGCRLLLRAAQIRLLGLLDREMEWADTDLERMIHTAGSSYPWESFVSLLYAGPMNPIARPGVLARRALAACRIGRRLPPAMSGRLPRIPGEVLIWFGIGRVESRDDLREIFSTLQGMTADERRNALEWAEYREVGQLLADGCAMVELDKPDHKRDWGGALDLLKELLAVAQLPGAEALRAPAYRARAVILVDHLGQPQQAIAELDEAASHTDGGDGFLLEYTRACILQATTTPEDSLASFERSLGKWPRGFPMLEADACRRAAEAAGKAGLWSAARSLTLRAAHSFRKAGLEYERLEMIGELAWCWWSSGDRVKAVSAMSGIVRRLTLEGQQSSTRYREVFRKAGIALAWMTSQSRTAILSPGAGMQQQVLEPFSGWFSRSRPQLADESFHPVTVALLTVTGEVALGVKSFRLAERIWCDAKTLANAAGDEIQSHYLDLELAQLAAREGDYKKALVLALKGSRFIPAAREARIGGASPFAPAVSVEAIWRGLGFQERADLQKQAFWYTVAPALTSLLATEASPAKYEDLLASLASIFESQRADLVDPEYWDLTLAELRRAFSPLATRETIQESLRDLDLEEGCLRSMLNLALSLTPNASLRLCVSGQAVTYDLLLRLGSPTDVVVKNVAQFVIRFWKSVLGDRAFALSLSRKLVDLISSAGKHPMTEVAARVLLWAEVGVGVTYSKELKENLLRAGGRIGEGGDTFMK